MYLSFGCWVFVEVKCICYLPQSRVPSGAWPLASTERSSNGRLPLGKVAQPRLLGERFNRQEEGKQDGSEGLFHVCLSRNYSGLLHICLHGHISFRSSHLNSSHDRSFPLLTIFYVVMQTGKVLG